MHARARAHVCVCVCVCEAWSPFISRNRQLFPPSLVQPVFVLSLVEPLITDTLWDSRRPDGPKRLILVILAIVRLHCARDQQKMGSGPLGTDQGTASLISTAGFSTAGH